MVWRTDRPGGERAHGPKQAMTGEKSPAVHKNVSGDPMTAVLTRARRLPGRFRSPDHKRCADPYRRRSWMQRHDAVLRKSGRLSALGQAGRGTRAIRSPDRPSDHRTPRILLWLLQTVSPLPTPVKSPIAPRRSGFPRRRSLPVSPGRRSAPTPSVGAMIGATHAVAEAVNSLGGSYSSSAWCPDRGLAPGGD
jgi:hypothetical protein